MKTSEAFWMFLSSGLGELFKMGRFERRDQVHNIWLDEKKLRSEEDKRNPNIVARGYTDYVEIQHYSLRGRPVFLHMRKNKWWDKIHQRDIQLQSRASQRGMHTAQQGVHGFFKR